jgi:hypothetical protein
MIALLWALLDRTDYYRQVVKLGLLLVLADFVTLFVAETIIAASVETWLHPAISIFGILWMATTAISLWIFGGAPADVILVAGMVERPSEKDKGIERQAKEACEPARAILRAVKFFFLFEGLVVCYFMLVPIWHFWAAHFAMMILLTVFIICGNLLHLEWPLMTFRKWSKAIMIALLIGVFFLAGYNLFTGKELTGDKIKAGAQSLKTPTLTFGNGNQKALKKSGPATPKLRAKTPTPREPYSITVPLRSDWSEPIYFPPRVKMEFFGPKAEFRREADGFIGDTYSRYPDDPLFQSGLRFRGPEGQQLQIEVVPG